MHLNWSSHAKEQVELVRMFYLHFSLFWRSLFRFDQTDQLSQLFLWFTGFYISLWQTTISLFLFLWFTGFYISLWQTTKYQWQWFPNPIFTRHNPTRMGWVYKLKWTLSVITQTFPLKTSRASLTVKYEVEKGLRAVYWRPFWITLDVRSHTGWFF